VNLLTPFCRDLTCHIATQSSLLGVPPLDVESVAHEQPPELPEGRSGFWKRSDGRDESGVDDHDANEIDNYADGQNRESSTC